MRLSTSWDESSGESIRTTKTSVLVSDTPYRRMASVICKKKMSQNFQISQEPHIVRRIEIVQNLRVDRPRPRRALRLSDQRLDDGGLDV